MSVWQPIETAPKYEQILMLMKHGVIEGQWDGEVGSGYYSRHMEWYATHWMPLPKPPADLPFDIARQRIESANENKTEI